MPTHLKIKAIRAKDRPWILEKLTERWGSTNCVSRGVVHHADQLPGFIAYLNGRRSGLITINIVESCCEIVTLDSFRENIGVGSALIREAEDYARKQNCASLWLITTNDNIQAQKFYQNRGFKVVAIHRNAIEKSRKLKPEIPDIGMGGIPIRDEIELELPL
jgi:ribosomal protein S18 acetylase RimI-like enzyme